MGALYYRRRTERLAGALTALTLPVLLFWLLLRGLGVPVRAAEEIAETVFLLPRLQRREPIVIDARAGQRQGPATAALPSSAITAQSPSTQAELPPYARPPSDQALLAAFARSFQCRPDASGRPARWAHCNSSMMRPGQMAALVPAPAMPVAREKELAAERARERAPVRVPCVSMRSNNMGFGQVDQEVSANLVCVLEEMAK